MSTAERIDELRNRFSENPRRYFASLANELRKAGEPDEAIAICRRLLPTLPGHMSGYIVLGQALYETERLDEARGVFEEALSHDPENLIALRHLGDIDRRQGNPAAARRWYERVLEADPRNDDIAAHLMLMGTPLQQVVAGGAVADVVAETPGADVEAEAPVADVEAPRPAPAVAPEELPTVTGVRRVLEAAEDPFGFGVPLEEVLAVDGPFEEGLVAPAWPDTTALEARRSGDRPAVPVPEGTVDTGASSGSPDVVAAFGAEPHDVPAPRMPGDGQPWITEPPRKTREVEVIAEAIAEDARASGEPDGVAVFAHPDPEPVEVTPFSDVHPEVTVDVPDVPDVPDVLDVRDVADAADVRDVGSGGPGTVDGFATETMGELLASQGLIGQAIGVYETLVRQRPEAVALATRLDELRAQQASPPVSASRPWRTAKERFGALAARRARRMAVEAPAPAVSGPLAPTVRMPAVTEPPPTEAPLASRPALESTQRSLASLFGSPSPDDEAAASTLSGMFGGTPAESPASSGTTAWLDALSALPSQTVPEPRTPTPWGASPAFEPEEPLGFDRAYPDPGRVPAEPVVDPQTANDLAEFSAWLKGLGSP